MFTADDLTRLAKACGATPNAAVVAGIVENRSYLTYGGINTPARVAEFLAQACLETDYFRVLEEYASGKAYEGRKDLGNVVAGDGVKFKGRGIFQCTGRDNYARYGKRLGLDLLKEPTLAERPDISIRIAVMYWNDKGLNEYADRGDTKAISRAINRGNPKARSPANHEADRIKIAKLAREIIKPVSKPVQPAPAPELPKATPLPVSPPAATPEPPPAVIVSDVPLPKTIWQRLARVFGS
jgi:putative chitinase